MSAPDFKAALTALGQRLTGEHHMISAVRRLTGGANMESWWVDYGPHKWVLRRLPEGVKEDALGGDHQRTGIPLALEAEVLKVAHTHGVTSPKVVDALQRGDRLGTGFVMQRMAGESMPHKILGNPAYSAATKALPEHCARELSAIHAVPLTHVPAGVPSGSTADALDVLEQRYRGYGAAIAVFELGLGWLRRNMPLQERRALLHGDFRMGNLLIDAQGISSVLDWELAHIGDPAQDIAYLCTPSWRFGHYDQAAGGFGALDDLLARYAQHSGLDIPHQDIQFWLVFAVLTWGVATLKMITLWRTGQDRSLERTVIGRRTSETEVDLLLILEDVLGVSAATQSWTLPTLEPLCGDTDASELTQALIDWTQDSVMPSAQGRDLFQARVARNAMRGLMREVQYGAHFRQAHAARLNALGVSHDQLCETLKHGKLTPECLIHLRLDVLERMAIDQPKYAGFAKAKSKWTISIP